MTHITDYSTLKSAVRSYCARNDNDFVNNLDIFVNLAEVRIYNGSDEASMPSDPLRCLEMQTSAPITINNGLGPLPVNFLEFISINWDSDVNYKTQYVPSRQFVNLRPPAQATEIPFEHTIDGNAFRVTPLATGVVNATFYQKLAPLHDDGDSNAILLEYPDIYLNGMLVAAYRFIRDNDRAVDSFQAFSAAVNGANSRRAKQMTGGQQLTPYIQNIA